MPAQSAQRRERTAGDDDVDDLGGDHRQQPERRVLQREEADGREHAAAVQVEQAEHGAQRDAARRSRARSGKAFARSSFHCAVDQARLATLGPMSFDPRSTAGRPCRIRRPGPQWTRVPTPRPRRRRRDARVDRGREPRLPPRPPARGRPRPRPLGRLRAARARRLRPHRGPPRGPVATVDGWPTGLSVPGGRSVDAWAVSAVTVSPTHRRRGIARALMEGELANARNAGAALAMLTVTEATIYGRYGYAPAPRAATITVDRRSHALGRAGCPGPPALRRRRRAARGRARRSRAERWRARPARSTAGRGILDRALGLVDADGDDARAIRVVRYDDEHGQPQGFATYRITPRAERARRARVRLPRGRDG